MLEMLGTQSKSKNPILMIGLNRGNLCGSDGLIKLGLSIEQITESLELDLETVRKAANQ